MIIWNNLPIKDKDLEENVNTVVDQEEKST